MICRAFKNATAVSCGKFCSSFFKSSSEPPRSAVALRRGRNSFIRPKRHRRVNFRRRRKEGNRTSGGFPFLHKAFLNCLPAFFFGSRGANENSLRCAQLQLASRFALSKKEHAAGDVSPRARGDQRSARWMGGRFLRKTANSQARFARVCKQTLRRKNFPQDNAVAFLPPR